MAVLAIKSLDTRCCHSFALLGPGRFCCLIFGHEKAFFGLAQKSFSSYRHPTIDILIDSIQKKGSSISYYK